MVAVLATAAAGLTRKQMADAERIEVLTVPTPAEFFAAINNAGKPDWASFYRPPMPSAYPDRPQAALNLGTLVTDAFVAVEAQDGQQVKNTGKDIIALAGALGVGEQVLGRGKSISDFADKNDWFALREELDATIDEVRQALAGQRDEPLASLITAGAWLRALAVGSRALELGGDEQAAGLLRQRELVAFLRAQLEKLPEKMRLEPVVAGTDTDLAAIEEIMTFPGAEPFGAERVAGVSAKAAQAVDAIGTKNP